MFPTINNPNIMNLENYVKMRALENASNSSFLDHMLAGDQGDEIREKILTKRLQFDTTPYLYGEVEAVCELLNCSKREFLEMAVADAIKKVSDVFEVTYKDATGEDFFKPAAGVPGKGESA